MLYAFPAFAPKESSAPDHAGVIVDQLNLAWPSSSDAFG
jgi:hypothetical protein